MKRFGRVLAGCCALGLMLLSGCSQQAKQISDLKRSQWVPEEAHWPELDAIMSNQEADGTSIGKMLKMRHGGDYQGPPRVCNLVSNKKFQEILKKFDETPIPAKYVTPEREKMKKDLLAACEELKDGCTKKANTQTLNAVFDKIEKLTREISVIPGQTPPTGKDAEKYSPP